MVSAFLNVGTVPLFNLSHNEFESRNLAQLLKNAITSNAALFTVIISFLLISFQGVRDDFGTSSGVVIRLRTGKDIIAAIFSIFNKSYIAI